MKNIKNYLIAILAGLLVLTLTTHNATGAGPSKAEKIINYQSCVTKFLGLRTWNDYDGTLAKTVKQDMAFAQVVCSPYRP